MLEVERMARDSARGSNIEVSCVRRFLSSVPHGVSEAVSCLRTGFANCMEEIPLGRIQSAVVSIEQELSESVYRHEVIVDAEHIYAHVSLVALVEFECVFVPEFPAQVQHEHLCNGSNADSNDESLHESAYYTTNLSFIEHQAVLRLY